MYGDWQTAGHEHEAKRIANRLTDADWFLK